MKAVCKVLALDSGVESEVQKLRRSLLSVLGVREFSTKGQWSDPCRSFTLPDVICTFCNYRQDLDLCRDAGLVGRRGQGETDEAGEEEEEEQVFHMNENSKRMWCIQTCSIIHIAYEGRPSDVALPRVLPPIRQAAGGVVDDSNSRAPIGEPPAAGTEVVQEN